MKITKPIFIVGTGRCGSTAFHSLLARHPSTMWLSGFAEYFPDKPAWNRWAVTAVGNPLVRRIFGKRIKPGENYGFWYTHAYGFAEPGRDIVVVEAIPKGPGQTGMIQLDRETWRAESSLDIPIAVGSTVLVQRVDGVRLVVLPVTEVES